MQLQLRTGVGALAAVDRRSCVSASRSGEKTWEWLDAGWNEAWPQSMPKVREGRLQGANQSYAARHLRARGWILETLTPEEARRAHPGRRPFPNASRDGLDDWAT